ncbi:MAG: ABC transporter permease [Verrucomicrobia bacterium]|nr:ABC transporter permease [Verrucomicrobiota bacterium]
MLSDFRFALRQLAKNPSFAAVAIFALALGIGGNTAIFSVVNAVLLKPLPFVEPERIVAVGSVNLRSGSGQGVDSVSYPDYFDFRSQARSFSALACYYESGFAVANASGAEGARGLVTTADLFPATGVKPLLGRLFTREDEVAGGGPGGLKVVLGHAYWQRQFGGREDALGRQLTIDGRVYTVVGVLPALYQFPIQTQAIDFYVTTSVDATPPDVGQPQTAQRGSHRLRAVGRLAPGATVEQAAAELRSIAAALMKQYPETNTNFSATAIPLREELIGDVRLALWVLCGAVGCVLLIACVNVANLLLARASARGREIAVRTALGASQGRIVRQLLTESVVLAACGGVLGLLLAYFGARALVAVVPQSIPLATDLSLDVTVLAFTLGIALATGIFFGLVPALQAARSGQALALKTGARGNTSGGHRLRNALVVVEIALALVLLVGAGLLLRSFSHLGKVDPGFRYDRLLTARIGISDTAYPKPENVVQFFDRLLERVRAIPGVRSASTIVPLPLSGSNMTTSVDIEERSLPEGQQATAPVRLASAGYFDTLGIPIVRGRVFDANDTLKTKLVVVVNEKFAQQHYPGQDPIGKRIKPGWSIEETTPWREIVGVVGNTRHRNLYADYTPEMYLPAAQVPLETALLVVKSETSNPLGLVSAVRAAVAEIDRGVPVNNVRTFDEYLSRSLARPRFNALLLGVFAAVALLLTAVGVYGVMAYSVSQRTGEIGVRMALGAEQGSIFRLIVGEAMTLVALSIGLGLAGAFALTRLLASLLHGVSAWDPLTFSVISLVIAAVAFLACWLPARRAARVNPIEALRAE